MKIWIILIAYSIFFIGTARAEIYQWTDEDGVSHWTDVEPVHTDEFETIDEIKIAPQQQPDRSIEPPQQIVKDKTPVEKNDEQPIDTKETQYQKTYLALKKLSSGLDSGVGWALYYEWLGEAGLEVNMLKESHSDWAQRNNKYETRCEMLFKAYECYFDASSLWETRRKKERDKAIEFIETIAKKNNRDDPMYMFTASRTYNWREAAKSLEQFLFKEADIYLDKYTKE